MQTIEVTNCAECRELEQYINDSEIVKAAITEAVHRYYYDRILNSNQDLIFARDALSSLWNENPNWRRVLKHSADRYNEAEVIALPISSKPLKQQSITVKLKDDENNRTEI